MVKQGVIQKKAVEGMEGSFTTKADLKRAWEQKVRDEIRAEKEAIVAAEQAEEQEKLEALASEFKDMFTAVVDNRPKKELPSHVVDMIEAAKSKLLRDEFECLVDPDTITTSTFCCLDHYDECIKMRDSLEDMNRMLLQADIQVAADRVDYHDTTFVCRYQLKLILHHFLKKCRLSMTDDRVEELLDGCVMNHHDQVRLREWADPEKRSNPLFDIPLSGYSTNRFSLLISTELNALQQKKIIVTDDD
jgi:uncharacterized membrane protein YheB (UPF0754 family)